MRVLAIDPGFDRLGIAVLEGNASRPTLVWSDCIQPPKGEKEVRLAAVSEAIDSALREYSPDVVALETLFFSTNKKTAFGVAEARGVVLSCAGIAGVTVREFSPGTIKLAVTGNGRADKKAMGQMIPLLMKLPPKKRLDDELDAIAVGITALCQAGYPH
jgi:crossover junction endodeoxyribonuclease RuvC